MLRIFNSWGSAVVMTAMGREAARAVVELKSSHTNNKSCLVLLRFAKEVSLHLDCFPGLVRRLVIFLACSSLCRFFYFFTDLLFNSISLSFH